MLYRSLYKNRNLIFCENGVLLNFHMLGHSEFDSSNEVITVIVIKTTHLYQKSWGREHVPTELKIKYEKCKTPIGEIGNV